MQGVLVQENPPLDFKPWAGASAGDYIQCGSLIGFVMTDLDEDQLGALMPCGGKGQIWRLPKPAGYVFTAGEKLRYNIAEDAVVDVGVTDGSLHIGYAIPQDGVWFDDGTTNPATVAEAGDTEVWVYTGGMVDF